MEIYDYTGNHLPTNRTWETVWPDILRSTTIVSDLTRHWMETLRQKSMKCTWTTCLIPWRESP